MSGFGCWIQPQPTTILTFLPVFDSTTASILEKFDLSSSTPVTEAERGKRTDDKTQPKTRIKTPG